MEENKTIFVIFFHLIISEKNSLKIYNVYLQAYLINLQQSFQKMLTKDELNSSVKFNCFSLLSEKLPHFVNKEIFDRKLPNDILLQNRSTDAIIKSYEFYNSEKVKNFYETSIKPNDTMFCYDDISAIGALVSLKEQNLQYNAIHFKMLKALSKNNRVAISRSGDIFIGIRIPCLSLDDIQEVSLFSSGILNENNDPNEYFNPQAKIVYTPIKTITKFTSNLVEFYDNPIFIANEAFNGLSVQVKFNEKNGSYNKIPLKVELNFLVVGNEARIEMTKNYSRYNQSS